jgi:hypothetical protein
MNDNEPITFTVILEAIINEPGTSVKQKAEAIESLVRVLIDSEQAEIDRQIMSEIRALPVWGPTDTGHMMLDEVTRDDLEQTIRSIINIRRGIDGNQVGSKSRRGRRPHRT